MFFILFSPHNVEVVLKSLDPFKLCGLYGIEAKFLKFGAAAISSSLCSILNLSLMSGNFPSEWKTAVVAPVFKKCDRVNPANYHLISLLPCDTVCQKCLNISFLSNYLITWKEDVYCLTVNMAFTKVV